MRREGDWEERKYALQERWFLGDKEAITFIRALGHYVETWDDLIDKDKELTDEDINATFTMGLLDIASNPFVARHQATIGHLLALMVNGWMCSEEMKRSDDRRVRQVAFHLRNWPLELYPAVALCVGGWLHMRAVSVEIRTWFADEDFDEWEHANG